MKTKKLSRKLWLIPFIAILIIGLQQISIAQNAPAPVVGKDLHTHTVLATAVSKITKENELVLTGNITAYDTAVVSSKIAGRVNQVLVKNGAYVVAGQPLVTLETGDYNRALEISQTQLKKAIFALETSQAQLENAAVVLANTASNLERLQTLHQAGAIAQKDYDDAVVAMQQAETAALVASAGVQMTESGVLAAEIAVTQATEQLADTTIKAKLNGVVTGREVTLGQVLAPGVSLMELHQITPIYAVVNIPQRKLAYVEPGQQVQLTVDTYPGHQFTGAVELVERVGNPGARTFTTKIKIANQEKLLKPAMFAQAQINMGETEVLAIPQQAFFSREDQYFVFVAENGLAKSRQVETGQVIGQLIEVKSGLTEGETVIITSVSKLKDGDAIIIEDKEVKR